MFMRPFWALVSVCRGCDEMWALRGVLLIANAGTCACIQEWHSLRESDAEPSTLPARNYM